jgi:hypothetical protein
MSDDNKRDDERVSVPAPLHGEVKVYQPMTILDISMGGAQIETPFALQIDSLHDFRLSLGERSLVIKGRIAHCHIGELKEGVVLYRSGVEFIESSAHVQSAIVHFVEALKLVQKAQSTAGSAAAPRIVEGELAE